MFGEKFKWELTMLSRKHKTTIYTRECWCGMTIVRREDPCFEKCPYCYPKPMSAITKTIFWLIVILIIVALTY